MGGEANVETRRREREKRKSGGGGKNERGPIIKLREITRVIPLTLGCESTKFSFEWNTAIRFTVSSLLEKSFKLIVLNDKW